MTHINHIFQMFLYRTKYWSWQRVGLAILLCIGFNILQAQNCTHPADTDSVLDGTEFFNLGPDTNTDGIADYVEANATIGQDSEDGFIQDLSATCSSTAQNLSADLVSGATYGFILSAGNSYTFSACSTTDPGIYPVLDAWNALADNATLVAASTTSTDASGATCSTLSISNTATCTNATIYVAVNTQNHGLSCQPDWRSWTTTYTCTTCEITAGEDVIIGADSDPTTACTAGTIEVPVPTITSDCINTIRFDVNNVLPSGTTFSYNGTNGLLSGSGFALNSILNPNIITIDPSVPVGSYNVTWETEDCAGNTVTDSQLISVQPVMACNHNLNITLPSGCQVEITPAIMLAAPCTATSEYQVTVMGQTSNVISTPGTYDIQVEYAPGGVASGLYCWGSVTVEDKTAPECNAPAGMLDPIYTPCKDFSVAANAIPFASLDASHFVDCSGVDPTVTSFDRETPGCGVGIMGDADTDDTNDLPAPDPAFFTDIDADGIYEGVVGTPYEGFVLDKVVSRVWTPTDGNGMVGESCVQYAYVFRPTASLIVFPQEAIVSCADVTFTNGIVDVNSINLSAAQVPHFLFDQDGDGVNDTISIEHTCKMVATYIDSDPITLTCGQESKIIRNWSIYDWCEINAGNSGVVIQNMLQRILIKDISAPDYLPADATYSIADENDVKGGNGTDTTPDTINTIANGCYANVNFRLPQITNTSCSNLTYSLEVYTTEDDQFYIGHNYNLTLNDLFTTSIERDSYYLHYIVENDCNNMKDTITRYFEIVDIQGPIVACTPTNLTLNNVANGTTQICALNVINPASTDDNCSGVSYTMRLKDSGDDFTECITVSCANFGSPLMVEVQATDNTGNTSELCWTTVNLKDDNATCNCSNAAPTGFSLTPNATLQNLGLGDQNGTQLTMVGAPTTGTEEPIFSTVPSNYTVNISETNANYSNSILFDCNDVPTGLDTLYAQITNTQTNNTNHCFVEIQIDDTADPSINCANLGYQIEVASLPSTVRIEVDSLIKYNSAIILEDRVSDNCASDADLLNNMVFSYNGSPNASYVDITITTSGASFNVDVLTFDNSGNNSGSPCSMTFTSCQTGDCMRSIRGKVESEEATEIEDVGVELLGSNMDMIMTDENGEFEFETESGNDYTVKLSKNDDYLNGVSTYDLVKLGQHVLGIEELDSPYKMIAGDANSDGYLSTIDLVTLRQLILYQITELPNVGSWRFVDRNYVFPVPNNPWFEAFPENYFIQNANSDMNLGFVGVKVGDVDCSAQTLRGQAEERNANGTLQLLLNDTEVEIGEEFTVALNVPEIHTVQGLQFTMAFDTKKAELLEVVHHSSLMSEHEIGQQFTQEGMLTASFINTNVKAKTDAPLMVLKMKANQNTSIKDIFELSNRYTRPEAYNTANELLDLNLAYNTVIEDATAAMNFQLFQNKPNPFRGHTTIGFYLPQAQAATLTVYDVSGKTLYQNEQEYTKGYNEIILKKEELTSGVMYYQLDTEGFTQTRKMIVLE